MKNVEGEKSKPLTYKYMTAHFSGLIIITGTTMKCDRFELVLLKSVKTVWI